MLAVIYPGQGSQFVGMGDYLVKNFPLAKQIFEEASDTLSINMLDLCLNGPEDQLQLTTNTQPALLTISTVTHRVIDQICPLPAKAGAGHSVGEYAALVAAGVISFPKALELVRMRGKLMQESVPVGLGGMAAVMGLDVNEVDQLCQWAMEKTGSGPLEPANYNCPGQTVISGNFELIQWVSKNFTPDKIGSSKSKVRLIPLKVSAPFHCSMMKTAENEMAGLINEVEFKSPLFPVVQNFTGKPETDPRQIQKNLISQISGPVRWVECVEQMGLMGVERFTEMGPGKVLNGLIRKINDSGFEVFNFNNLEDIKTFEKQMNH